MRLKQGWKQADFFRRVPKDLTEATLSGAIMSALCVTVMVVLFLGEVKSYIFPRIQSDMVVEADKDTDGKIRVSLDMTFPKLACPVLSLDILDVLHNHKVNSMANITKTRLTASGDPLGNDVVTDKLVVNPTEGCNLKGFIEIGKVPGNFHVSAHSFAHVLSRYYPRGINVQHIIHHLSFGETDVKKLAQAAQLHPLDGTRNMDAVSLIYQYYIDLVPTTYEGTFTSARTFQFTSNMNKHQGNPAVMPAVIFQYQIAPITVKYSTGRVPFTHFLTYICAIIGGVFTVAGLLSRLIYTSTAQLQRRLLGKEA